MSQKSNPDVEIYMLSDPRDFSIRYIGMSKNAKKRFVQHIQRRGENPAKEAWIRELLELQKIPYLSILETVEGIEKAREREAYWIWLLNKEHPLLNFNLNTANIDGGTRIDDPELAAHVQEEIERGRQ